MFSELLAEGATISEMPFTWEPRAHDFPRRNRLISGLSLGVVVVEAAGSLITARFAAEQGREVFSVPGSPLEPRSEGTNGRLKQGATPVTEAADVIAAIEPIRGRGPGIAPAQERAAEPPGSPDTTTGDEERRRFIALLGPTPISIDDLMRLACTSATIVRRLEEHTSELQSLRHLVCRLLLEKKKNK